MNSAVTRILLADDDRDDSVLFQDALDEIGLPIDLFTVRDGEELMQLLYDKEKQLPDILFLDLNMPRKNGFECLSEIKRSSFLSTLPVIIFSTSFDLDIVEVLYKKGATHYIRKPNEFEKLKNAILLGILAVKETGAVNKGQDYFVIAS